MPPAVPCPPVQDSCPDYMLKAEDCLRLEEERVENYLHGSTKVGVCVAMQLRGPMAYRQAGTSGGCVFVCVGERGC